MEQSIRIKSGEHWATSLLAKTLQDCPCTSFEVYGLYEQWLRLAEMGTRQFGGINSSPSQLVGEPIWRENK